jgi:opacity protein-like surface antigen
MRYTLAAMLALSLAPSPLFAQEPPGVFLRGYGGVTFMSETATVFGGGVGFRLNDHVEILGELGAFTNVLPHSLQRDLDDAARTIGTLFGGPLVIDGKAPGAYGVGLVRVGGMAAPRLRLYVEAGGGTAYGESDITATVGRIDVSTPVVSALGIKESETAPVLVLGGGVTLPVADRVGLDIGYRFMRLFTDEPRINTANLSVGLRFGF